MSPGFDGEDTDAKGGRIRIRPTGKSRACLIMMVGTFPGETYVLQPNSDLAIGRAPGVEVRLRGPDISRLHAKIHCSASSRVELIDLGSTNGTFVNGKRQHFRVLREGDKIQFGERTVFRFAFHDEVDEEFQARLLGQPFLDPTTNTLRRDRLARELEVAHAAAASGGEDVAVVVMAVEGIDLLEQLLGIAVRDYFLRELSWIMRKAVAGEATLYRVAPDAFAAVFLGAGQPTVLDAADRLRRVVAGSRLTHEGTEMVFSVGVGVALLSADKPQSPQDLLTLAESRCRAANAAGGNRVEPAGLA